MHDPYLQTENPVLRNLLGITTYEELRQAEADYVSLRLKQLAMTPLSGDYSEKHYLAMHRYIFQDIYDWAGEIRKINIEKEEPALGGLSIEYDDVTDIHKNLSRATNDMKKRNWSQFCLEELTTWFSFDLARIWKIHAFREGNTRTAVTFCCQFADAHGFPINRTLFEENSAYVRTALVAYNAIFHDLGDRSQKQHLERIIKDALGWKG